MAVDTGALTLGQWALASNDPLIKKVTFSLLGPTSVFNDLPMMTVPTMKVNGTRIKGDLATVSYRNLNEGPTTTSSTPDPYSEQVYILSNKIAVDRLLRLDQNHVGDPLGVQVAAYGMAAAYDFTDKWINNDPVTGNAKAGPGLRWRLDNTGQSGLASDNKIDAGALDITPGAMTAATANTFLELMDQMLYQMGADEGDGCVFYVNETLKRRWARAIRVLGAGAGFNTVQDGFGRSIDRYKNAIVRNVGRKADQSTLVITNTEASTGAAGSSDYTSVYAVRYGEGATMGWQMEAFRPLYFPPNQDNATQEAVVIDYAFGADFQHHRGVARTFGLKIK